MRAPRPGVTAVAAVILMFALVPGAEAQVWLGGSGPRPGSVEISGGGSWSGGQDLASSTASLTPNPSGGIGSFDLFTSEPSLAAVFGGKATASVYITRALSIEGGFHYSRPQLKVRLADDAEDAPDVTATTAISQYLFTGSLVYHFGKSATTSPFIAAGAGHLRDLHAGNGLLETGTEFHALGGIKMWYGRRRNIGLRLEGGVSVLEGGFTFDEERRVAPTAAASLAYRF